jgi:hypothetical protein
LIFISRHLAAAGDPNRNVSDSLRLTSGKGEIMEQDWDIKPRSDRCGGCEKPFDEGQGYFSGLVFDEGGYRRADYCGVCWPQKQQEHAHYSKWQGVFHRPPAAPEQVLKKETAETLLRRFMETKDPANVNSVFILAVMLERKRVLVERDVQRDGEGKVTRVYEHRKSGETFVIADPALRLDQLEEVQKEVAALLGQPSRGEEPQEVARSESAAAGEAAEGGQDEEDSGVRSPSG